jgi:hypothetical protein
MNPTDQTTISNPDNLPVIEETSLHHIVLRVRDWQETIDKKFDREKAYLEFKNEEVNAFKKELLEEDNYILANNYFLTKEYIDISKFVIFNSNILILKNCHFYLTYQEDTCDFSYGLDLENIHLESEGCEINFLKPVTISNCDLQMTANDPIKITFSSNLYLVKSNITLEHCDKLIFSEGKKVTIKECEFNTLSITDLRIKKDFSLTECVFNNDIYLGRIILTGDKTFINDLDIKRVLTIETIDLLEGIINIGNYNYKKYGKLLKNSLHFIDYFVENIEDKELFYSELLDITIHNTNLSKITTNTKNILKFINSCNQLNNKEVIKIDWKTCEPKPYRHSIKIPSKYKEYYSFIEDFSTLFKRYAKVNRIPDISVAINPVQEGFEIVFESSVENNIQEKIVGVQANLIQFLSDPETFKKEIESWSIEDRPGILSQLNAVKTQIAYCKNDNIFKNLFKKIFGNTLIIFIDKIDKIEFTEGVNNVQITSGDQNTLN